MNSICLSLISGGSIKTDTVSCLLDTVSHCRTGINLVLPIGGYPSQSRTMAVRQALKAGNSHIMFIDSDMVFPPTGVDQLKDQNKSIIGAAYNQRRLPLVSTVKLADKNGNLIKGSSRKFPKKSFKVAAVGTGFCLIDLKVFKMPEPWFYSGYQEKDNDDFITEDVFFCQKAAKNGFEVWCDPTINIGHLGDYKY